MTSKQISLRKRISSFFFPKHSETLDRINRTPLFINFIKKYSNLPVARDRTELYEYLHTHLIGQSPIDYLEFGVFRGESLCHWSQMNTSPDSRFYGFDSFQGLPEKWNAKTPKGYFDTDGIIPSINDSRVHFIKGWFQDTVPQFVRDYIGNNRLVIHNDCDLYSSTLFCLTQLNHIMQPGAILIFDEFYDVLHEFQAFLDYTQAYRRKYRGLVATPYFVVFALMFE